MSENVPATTNGGAQLAVLTQQQVDLIKQTVAKGATDAELRLFLEVARATGLNPFAKEIYFFKIQGTPIMPVGIDGLRRKAAESGDYMGQAGPFFCGEDGVWKDIWLSKGPPAACRVGVLRHGNPEPTWAVVKWSEFAKTTSFWKDRPCHMMAIRAESHALRKAAPRLVQKMQAAGAQVMDADYLIAKAEQLERQRALPQHTPPGDLNEELYGQDPQTEPGEETSGTEGDKKEEPAKWTQAGVKLLQAAVAAKELGSKEWRRLLGLPEGAEKSDLEVLGTPEEVVKLLEAGFAKAVAAEPVEQAKLGF